MKMNVGVRYSRYRFIRTGVLARLHFVVVKFHFLVLSCISQQPTLGLINIKLCVFEYLC